MAWDDEDGNVIDPTEVSEGNPTKMSDHNSLTYAAWCIQNSKGNDLPALVETTYMPDPNHEAGGKFWALVEIKHGASATIVDASDYDGICSNDFKNHGFLNRYVTVSGRCILVNSGAKDIVEYAPGGDYDNWWSGDPPSGVAETVHGFFEYIPVFAQFMDADGENATRDIEITTVGPSSHLYIYIDPTSGDMTAHFHSGDGGDYYIVVLFKIEWTPKWPNAAS